MGRRTGQAGTTPALTRERTLEVALAVADSEGIAAVSMRRLARELEVEAASLYHHVTNKDQILDGLVELVAAEIELPERTPDWRDAIARRARHTRSCLRRHPWAVSLMASRTSPGPATLGLLEAGIRCFRDGGFTVHQAAQAISTVDSYVHGFALQEVNLPFHDEIELAAMTAAIMETFPASDLPHLYQLTVEHVLQPGYAYGDQFEPGLTAVLDGLAALRER